MTFTDPDGKQWHLRLTVGLVGKIRERTGFDLSTAVKEKRFAEVLFEQPETIVRLLWILCEKQAAAEGVSPEDFGSNFDGPALQCAVDALVGAVIDFFHRPAVATHLKSKLPEAMSRMEQATIRMIDTKISTLNESAGD